jgi:hypothetical protein
MRTWIRSCVILLPCITAEALFSPTTYTINVSVNGGGMIKYAHGSGGINGHQFARMDDTIIWQCDPRPPGGNSCSAVVVKFKSGGPCTISMNNCKITDNSSLAIYPYSIAVSYNGGIVLDDPDVIVDNAGVIEIGKRAADKKAPPKKK